MHAYVHMTAVLSLSVFSEIFSWTVSEDLIRKFCGHGVDYCMTFQIIFWFSVSNMKRVVDIALCKKQPMATFVYILQPVDSPFPPAMLRTNAEAFETS